MFWGYYELKPVGSFAFHQIWHPNPDIKLSADEQYNRNKENFDDFSVFKYLPPAIKMTFG